MAAYDLPPGAIFPRGFDLDDVGFPPVFVREFANLRYGKALQEGIRRPGSVPVYGTNGRCGWHDTALAQPPGVILGRKGQGHLGVEWCEEPFWVIDTAYYADLDRSQVDPRWFYYITNYVGLDELKTGEKPGLNRDTFLAQVFPLPPLDEQRAIAEVLGALDDKVELNRQVNHTLEEMASALFKSWFVDFDPIVAKADGRRPFGMDAATAALFPSAFKDGVPTGWRWSTIGAEVSVVGGSTPSTANPAFWDGTHCWCTPRDMSKLVDPVVLDTERRITDAGVASISSGLLPVGTVLLSSRAPIGYTAIAAVPLAINQGFIAMRCDKTLPNHFVLWWTRANMDEVESRAGGTTFAEISKSAFRPIPVVVPTPQALRAFVAQVAPWHDLVVHNLRESRTLIALRDTLLPKLLSGEVRLKQAEKLVGAAL